MGGFRFDVHGWSAVGTGLEEAAGQLRAAHRHFLAVGDAVPPPPSGPSVHGPLGDLEAQWRREVDRMLTEADTMHVLAARTPAAYSDTDDAAGADLARYAPHGDSTR